MPDWPALIAPSSVTFADLLRHHRTAAGLTQEELANRANLSVDAISTLERGARRRPRKDTVALLAEALALPDEERTAFAAAARWSPAAALVATPPGDAAAFDGHALAPDAALPHGVVTFLIAEIEDSTRLFQELGGDRYAELLAEVQVLLGTVWPAHAGHELGTQGDRFFAVFAYADDALSAAAAAQQALAAHVWLDGPEGVPVRVRTGLHSGAALLTAGRYVGQEVHRAACIAAAGHGGQIVVSGAVAEQVAKFGYRLPDGARLQSLGKHRLPDLPQREELSQLVLPDLPGLPAAHPPLRTLDAWPGLRADLTAVVGMSAVLLAVAGLLLALVVPAFPWAIGLGAAGLAGAVLLGALLAQPVRRVLETQWRDARKPVSAVTSALLSLVVVVTTLFLTTPPIFIKPQNTGYDFSYTYHRPTHTGDKITIGLLDPLESIAPYPLGLAANHYQFAGYLGLWQSCLTQLPNVALGFDSYQPDQCTQVPTIDNGGESLDGRTTTFHIDPRAAWSDGFPLTAADFLFAQQLFADPNINLNGPAPFNLMQLSAPDPHTVEIHWAVQYGDFLAALAALPPLPLHVYATGAFAAVYDPRTDAYNAGLALQLIQSASFNTAIAVDDGPFTVQQLVPHYQAVLVRNPRFFSNFFHTPALSQVTLLGVGRDFPMVFAQGKYPTIRQAQDDLIATYRRGGLEEVEGLGPTNLSQFGGIPKNEVIISPGGGFTVLAFNQRAVAPNARTNGGTSMFTDRMVRQAFVEAFDRCAAVRAQLGITVNCTDPNLFTDELAARPAPDYDPMFKLPTYNPTDAARLLTRAGYRVVDGVRRAKDGTTPLQLTLIVPKGDDTQALTTQIQQVYAKNLHIGVTVASFAWLAPSNPTVTGAFDLFLFGEVNDPDPVGSPFLQGANWQSADTWLGLVDPYVVARDQLGSKALNDAERAGVYRSLQRYVSGLLDNVPVYITADITLTKPTLCNFKKSPLAGSNLWNMADWYVASSCPS